MVEQFIDFDLALIGKFVCNPVENNHGNSLSDYAIVARARLKALWNKQMQKHFIKIISLKEKFAGNSKEVICHISDK